MKHTILAALMAVSTLALAQTSQDPWGGVPENSQVNTMSGPRFGISYIGEGSTAQVLNRVHQMDSTEFSSYNMPATLTTRTAGNGSALCRHRGPGGTRQWVAFIAGMEKGLFCRRSRALWAFGESSFEFATGPNIPQQAFALCLPSGTTTKRATSTSPSTLHLSPTNKDQILHWGHHGHRSQLGFGQNEHTGFRLTATVGFNLNVDPACPRKREKAPNGAFFKAVCSLQQTEVSFPIWKSWLPISSNPLFS